MKATLKILLPIPIFICILVFITPAISQVKIDHARIDSLQTVLSEIPGNDTSRVRILKSLSKLYLHKDARQSINYAQEAVEQSERLNLPADAMIYVYMAKAYSRIPDNENALSNFKTALSIAEEQKDTSSMATVHNATGIHYYNLRNVPAALYEFNKAIEYGQMLQERQILADAWFGKALAYNTFEEFKGMNDALQQYLAFADTNKEQRKIITCNIFNRR